MNSVDMMNVWLAEYSLSQDAMHVHQVSSAIEVNLRMIIAGITNDYRVIGIAETYEGAKDICRSLRGKLDALKPKAVEPEKDEAAA